jgi:phenylacetate-coenzyme A ligase PaaK-like adenylate-forming protein
MERFGVELTMRLWRAHRSLRRHEVWPRSKVVSYQASALRKLRSHAYAHSPFYQRWHAGLFDRPLTDLPVLTKERLSEAFDEIVTDRTLRYRDLEAHVRGDVDGLLRDRYVVVSTSGSSGRPALFGYDVDEWAWVLASLGRGTGWAGLDPGGLHRRRVATVGTMSPWHTSARAGMTLPGWWLPSMRVDASAPIGEVAEQLNAWQPDLLVTYGSLLGSLAEAQLAGQMAIAPLAIVCGADALPAGARRRARQAWGVPVFEEYASTETAGIAAECEAHDGQHLYEDLLVVEPVDADGRAVPEGTPASRLLVSVLFSRTLPLIRYELPDGLRVLTEACSCGRPFRRIGGVDGRASEALHLNTDAGAEVTINPVVVHEVMDVAAVAGWQLVQEPDLLRLRVVLGDRDGAATQTLAPQLARALGRHGAVVPPIELEPVASIEREPGGKVKSIKSLASRGEGVPT